MATEVRRIILEPKEAQQIFTHYSHVEGSPLPSGIVIGYEIVEEAPLEIVVSLQSEEGTQRQVPMVEHDIVSACLTFCLENKIPVARKSQKMVKTIDKKIVFDMAQSHVNIVSKE